MSEQKLKTPDKIIVKTIECIEKYGFDALTVRMIAEEAGVNIAAINYHFHSKENLMEKVKEISFGHMLEDLKEIGETPDMSPRMIIHGLCKYMLEGGAQFTEITRMHFYEAYINGNYEAKTYIALNELLKDVADRISKEHNIDRQELNISIHRLFASLIFVSIFPGIFEKFTGYNLKNEAKAREEFLENMINTLPF